MIKNKVEILSPAGDRECLEAAVNFGADAVYLAGEEFGMRTASKNFNHEQMADAVKFAHEREARVYVTCNTLPRNNELKALPAYLESLQAANADAVIVADLGVMELAKKHAPNLEIHMSTQTGIVNYAAANRLHDLGASRVVLARELSFEEIAEIRSKTSTDLEIECFVHGAMCVSFSGRCLISSYLTGRDANRGDCAQPCRWKYHLYEENRDGQFFPVEETGSGTFLYNSKDMCMIDYIPQLIESGISSLKIEGRAKSAYYTAVTTNAYRHAKNDYLQLGKDYTLAPWIREELNKISHREYSTGFFLGTQPGQTTSTGGYIRDYDVVAVSENYKDGILTVSQRNKFLVGEVLDVLPPSGIPFVFTVEKITNDKGENVDAAPHPMQILTIPCKTEVPKGSVIRRKRSI